MDRATVARMNQELGQHVAELQEISKKLNALIPKRATLMSQLSENEMVKKEFDLLTDESKVFKLNGPVLVKQDVSEAKVNVMNRLKFFQAEIERIDRTEKELADKQKKGRDEIMKIQETAKQLQQAAVKAQTAATGAQQIEAK